MGITRDNGPPVKPNCAGAALADPLAQESASKVATTRMTRMMPEKQDEHGTGGMSDAQLRDQELCRMAAFRLRETANRIATLANSAQDHCLRNMLIGVCDRLLREERDLLAATRPL